MIDSIEYKILSEVHRYLHLCKKVLTLCFCNFFRSLLERCLGAESELERSRSSLIELRRKLDDSQAALHELGRENQSIQVG